MTAEHEVLTRAARALSARDKAARAVKAADEDLRQLCREYEQANGCRGLAPFHLAQACRARGIAA